MLKGRGDYRDGEEKEKGVELKKEGKDKNRRYECEVSKSKKNKVKIYYSFLG